VLVEMEIAILYLACLESLESEMRGWGWCGKNDLLGPKLEESSLISAQLLLSSASGKVRLFLS
jgi:hypothetical protein